MQDLPLDAIILLNFGMNDIQFTLRHKMRREGFYYLAELLEEVAEGIAAAHELLKTLGFGTVVAVFAAPIVALDGACWAERSLPMLPPMLPVAALGQMCCDLPGRVAA